MRLSNLKIIVLLTWLCCALPAAAATLTVTNCADTADTGSLRWALTGAGANDVIDFAITLANAGYSTGESYPGLVTNEGTSNTWFRIIVDSNLPAISADNIQIRGLTQTLDVTNSMPIEIRKGDSSTANIGLQIAGNYCTIEGLAINGFSVGGDIAIWISSRSYNQIINNYIGTTATGEAAKGNYHGVYISGGSNYNLVKGNLISGNNLGDYSTGVCLITASNYNTVQGNYIGVKKSGTAALANYFGVAINNSQYNTIGGTTEAERNLISGNTYGVFFTSSAASNEVKGNYIGTDLSGASPVPNGYGAYIESSSHHNLIGSANLIARNTNAGVQVLSTAVYNTITMNTMEANGAKGILLEAGANEDVPYPVISSATIVAGTTTIVGTAQATSSVEVFKTEATPDTSGQGEGKTYLGTAACADGNWMLTVEGLAIGNKVTATTTTSNDSTSEFAVNVTVAEPLPPNTVVNCQDSGPGSLRQCMTDAVFGDTIAFSIPASDPSYEAVAGGNVWVIPVKTTLPNLTGGVYLNGATQTAYQGNQNPYGPEIVLSSEVTGGASVMYINTNNNTLEGVVINNVQGSYTIDLTGSYNTIRDCYIGTDATGEAARGTAIAAIWLNSGDYNVIEGHAPDNPSILSGNGRGIHIFSNSDQAIGNIIRGNYIGVNRTATAVIPNSYGIFLNGAGTGTIYTQIGGAQVSDRNIIGGNTSYGIAISNTTTNEVVGNYIGVGADGATDLGNLYGVELGTLQNSVIQNNVISGNTSSGIRLFGADYCLIKGNKIGTRADGLAAVSNDGGGIALEQSDFNTIGGTLETERNIVSGNGNVGITISNSATNEVKGNYFGLSANGSALGNVYGMQIFGDWSVDNIIGGGTTLEGNYISSNSLDGIYVNAVSNRIKNNIIGLAPDGITPRGNTNNGIYLTGSSSNTIEGNVISGHTGADRAGIYLSTSNSNTITGNKIGTNRTGTSAVGNNSGIYVTSAQYNTIGGSIEAERNIISGNTGRGIQFSGAATSNEVKGNYIGTDIIGENPLPNTVGVYIYNNSFNNIIGGSNPGEGNLISGNSNDGVHIYTNCDGNIIKSNRIGTKADGETALPNSIGIRLGGLGSNSEDNNIIGGDTPVEGNVISGNSSHGIQVTDCGSGNSIKNNYIGLSATREGALPNGGSGIYISGFSLSLDLISNEVKYNNSYGIYAANLVGDYQLVIRYGTIEANDPTTHFGVYNLTNYTVGCQYVDWRYPTGPYDPVNNLAAGRWFNPGGEGQLVTDYVDYRYWWGWGTVVPAAPDPLSGTAASSTSINWNWSDNTTREALYYVVASPSGDIKVTSEAGTTATTEAGLSPYTEYTRRAVAWKMDASSESTSFTVRTLPTEGKPTVEVTYPNGGEKLQGGAICNITFEAISDIGVKANSASFYFTTGEGWTEIMTGQSTEAAYAWTTPIITTTEAKVRVTVLDAADRIGTGESDAFFSIDSTSPTVGITYPNGGETLRAGRAYNITFNCSDISGVKPDSADFYYTTGESWVPIATGQPTTSACSWVTPLVSTTEAKVRLTVMDIFDQPGTGESAGFFTIDTAPSLEVIYPNGGQYLKGGAVYNISFSVTSEVGLQPNSANIYYTTGESWVPIAVGQATDAVVPWTMPVISTTEAKVRVTAIDTLGKMGTDESDAYFAIDSTPPVVGVVSPNGGELWRGGTTRNITYTASDNIGLKTAPITLKYSVNNGADFNTIAAGQSNSGTYSWLVPTVNTNEAKVSVTAEDLAGNITTDESNTVFTVDTTSPFVVSITPTNGATAVLISTEVVTVFSKEMSREATQNAFDLSASPGVAGVFDWNAGGTIMTFRPSANLENNKLYHISVAQTATDLAGNQLALAFSSQFTTIRSSDDESPHCVIQIVDRDRVASTLKRGDYISKRPWIRGVVTDNLALDSSSVKLYLNDVLLTPVLNILSPQRIEANYQFTTDLEDETLKSHTFKLEAIDSVGNTGVKQISDLKVASGSTRIIGPVLSYPQTFKPKSGTPALLVYNLSADADIMIYMFSTSAENVWVAKCLTGGAGGRAGYNEVVFDGRSLTNGSYLGNGIYTFKITANQRVIGTGYITIFD